MFLQSSPYCNASLCLGVVPAVGEVTYYRPLRLIQAVKASIFNCNWVNGNIVVLCETIRVLLLSCSYDISYFNLNSQCFLNESLNWLRFCHKHILRGNRMGYIQSIDNDAIKVLRFGFSNPLQDHNIFTLSIFHTSRADFVKLLIY